MDYTIFLDGLPKMTERQLEKELKRPMQQLGIYGYSVTIRPRKPQARNHHQLARNNHRNGNIDPLSALISNMGLQPGRNARQLPMKGNQAQNLLPQNSNTWFAFVIVPRPELKQRFIQTHGGKNPRLSLKLKGASRIEVKHPTKPHPINRHLLDGLQESQDEQEQKARRRLNEEEEKMEKSFPIKSVSCGVWRSIPHSDNEWMPGYAERSTFKHQGELVFRPKGVVIRVNHMREPEYDFMDDILGDMKPTQTTLSISYNLVDAVVTDSKQDIMFRVSGCPRIYTNIYVPEELQEDYRGPERERVLGWSQEHELYVGLSFVYRVRLARESDLGRVKALSNRWGIPEILHRIIPIVSDPVPFSDAFVDAIGMLQNNPKYPFPVAFQLSALISNGYLHPDQVTAILPYARRLIKDLGEHHAANALRYFHHEVSANVDPLFDPASGSTEQVVELLKQGIKTYQKLLHGEHQEYTRKKEQDMVLIHTVQLTPTGVMARGPHWESSNRVLRKYEDFTDHFLRVQFTEEDFEPFKMESQVSQDKIYAHFKQRLLEGITIVGRRFEFLGFSGSGLKAATCWFVAKFVKDGDVMTRERIIKDLGHFEHIKVPGRWAARIGQAFTDTIRSIDVDPSWEVDIQDVEHIDVKGTKRCFSDGVGKLSQAMLDKIYEQSETIETKRPTVFQIRYGGAKGMISLDPDLEGVQLCLRPSMKKFEGSNDRNLEICTWGKPLPMFLNRPLVMLLEGLGVPLKIFRSVQQLAIERLRHASANANLAAKFLQRQNTSASAIKLHWVIESLNNIGIDLWDDDFLQRGYELVLCLVLRDIKYRARIPIDNGITLLGVLDETGILQEGEVYAPYTNADNWKTLVKGNVMITRSPAHHPGDVQMARAVDVPPSSPLRKLVNCVVFSIHGDRPLPGMLSGGDLDGDLYNIIWDPRFHISRPQEPASYPPTQPKVLPHAVQLRDVAEFFIDFMKSNLLGLISIRHLHLADQESIFHYDCIELARLASVAVDFPKTGHGVEMKDLPRPETTAKPDWSAPSPRVTVHENKDLILEQISQRAPDRDADEVEARGYHYYKSKKALGYLYRDIDERQFLEEVSENLRSQRPNTALQRIWEWMLPWTGNVHRPYAKKAEALRLEWDTALEEICVNASETPWKARCSEAEVFFGVLLGRGAGTRSERERAEAMKNNFEETAGWFIKCLKEGSREEVLGRAMAVLRSCLEQEESQKRVERDLAKNRKEQGKSFAWVAVSVLLSEVDAIQKESKRAGIGHKHRRGG